jgi:hypothetical protein
MKEQDFERAASSTIVLNKNRGNGNSKLNVRQNIKKSTRSFFQSVMKSLSLRLYSRSTQETDSLFELLRQRQAKYKSVKT